MIEVKHISKTFTTGKGRKVRALNDVSFSVEKGEIFGIIGSSGAGKSTIIRCLNLLERPDTGEIWVDGKEFTRLSEKQLQQERRHIGMIFQHFNLLSSRTVFDNIAFPLELNKTPKEDIRRRVNELLDLVGLRVKANDYPSTLSGGQKQRVAIARALANNPSLLLCDEATSALDPETTKSILKLLQTINEKLNITIILITHEIQVIKAICHRVAVVQDGDIVELGNKEQIFGAPQNPHTAQFVETAVQAELPIQYQSMLQLKASGECTNTILRVHTRNMTDYSFSELKESFGIQPRIIEAHIETIGQLTLGSFILQIAGEQTEQAVNYLNEKYLKTEIIGYVPGSLQSLA